MEEIPTLRKSRDALRLTLAKVESNIKNYLHLAPVELDPVCLKKQLEILQTPSTSFIDVQQKLADKQEQLDRHHEEYGSMRTRLQGLLHLYEANEIADYIKELIEQLQASGRDKAKTWGSTLQDLNEETKRLTRLLTKPVAKTSSELKSRLRDYSEEIRSLKLMEMEAMEHSKESTTSASTDSSVLSSARRVKLPELKLTPFNGNPLDWPSFWEEFSSAVHNVPGLPESSKLSYLRSALRDETAIKIASPSTGYTASYDFVVGKLKKQYERKPLIHRKHMQSLVSLDKFSSSTYKGLLDMRIDIDKHIAGLKRLDQFDTEHLLASLIVNQFEPKLLDRWQTYSSEHSKDLIITDVLEFMDVTLSSWMHTDESVSKTSSLASSKSTKQKPKKQQSKSTVYVAETKRTCELCDSNYHPPYVCSKFIDLSVEQRLAHIQKFRLCRNCLGYGHLSKFCRSTYSCKKCNRKHHTLLHKDDSPSTANAATSNTSGATSNNSSAATTNVALPKPAHIDNRPSTQSTTLFMTCQVKVQTPDGHTAMARALLDTGSSTSFITAKLSNTLQAKKISSWTRISGIQGAEAPSSSHRTTVQLVPSVQRADGITLTPAIVDKITVDLPTQPAIINDISILKTLQLADPNFDRPGKIDILLGMDVYQWVVYPESFKVSSSITAQYSIFGWLLYGQASGESQNATAHLTLHSISDETSDQLLKAFWEVEEVHTPMDSYTSEEQLALDHYEKTTIKTSSGLYQVKLPRRPDAPTLGESRKQAKRRLVSTETSLQRKGKWDSFREVINDYFTSGHAELVPEEDMKKQASNVFYLPMHGVTKQSSTSTKLRAVFDGSAATSTGVSLNDVLLPGPNIYSPLPDILLRFRLHKIGLTADVSKMFRMVELHPSDRDLHRFLWKSENGEVIDCRMTRLTFGVTSSPFVAAQTLQRIASDNAELYPRAAEVVRKNFYVDDCLTGAESISEATELRAQLNKLLEQGNMQLRKWRSSSRSVINSVPEDLREQEAIQELPTPNELHKALGIHWDTSRDTLHVSIWWNGPPWLCESPTHWPSVPPVKPPEDLMETKTISYLAADTTWILKRYSSYHKLRTTVAWMLRFYHNCKLSLEKSKLSLEKRRFTLRLSVEEIRAAEELLWRLSQENTFPEQLQRLRKGNELATSDLLLPLHPFLDNHGVLRVGGRLQRSKLKYSQRHPVVLDRKDILTHLIVRYLHTTSCHAGPTLLLSLISRSFHVIAGKRLVRDICRKCVICRKQSQAVMEQRMGQLPPQRITPNNVFSTVGIDYAGPFLVKRGNPRKPTIVKNYLCVFVDFVVKAVHLELVTDLTAEAFVATLRRFTSRRGKPKEIFCDNGTNFVGAERDLRELYQLLQEKSLQDAVHAYCVHQDIQWHFSPERAPHFGGLWEAAVKSAKSLLKKTVGLHKFTYEELYTVITQVESCLNSRPLVPFDSIDEDGLDVLTPGHFLVGRPLEALPDRGDVQQQPSTLKRWNLCQLVVREFWHRWSTEYIRTLNRNNKWKRTQENIQVGDIILLKDSTTFQNSWPLGRIVETYPGLDGRVRVVLVKTAKTLLRRPICKLVLLLKERDKDEQSPPLGPRDVGASKKD